MIQFISPHCQNHFILLLLGGAGGHIHAVDCWLFFSIIISLVCCYRVCVCVVCVRLLVVCFLCSGNDLTSKRLDIYKMIVVKVKI